MPFTIGLGRNSPIPLEGDPKKYEGLIVRHGQWSRWTSARRCACILSNNRPDPRCTLCRGVGWRYSFQDTEEDMAVEAVAVDTNLLEMPYDIDASRLSLIQDGAGTIYHLDSVYGKWVKVQGTPFRGGEMVYVSVANSRAKAVSGMIATYLGHGLVQLSGYEYQNPWAKIPRDILSVAALRAADGQALTVLGFAVDKIEIDTDDVEPAIGETLYAEITYMPPYRIAILNQNLNEMDQRFLQEVGGDSVALFPFAYKVAEQDTVTIWAGTQVRKKILRKAVGAFDVLPDMFVSSVLRLEDTARTYVEGTHFVIWDRNTIRWLVATNLRPAEGANYSIEYAANLTYRVMQHFPNVRSSEDKRFPSRVAVKLQSGTAGGDPL